MRRLRYRIAFLALVIAISTAATGPAAASASEFKAGGYPATLTGSQLASERLQIFFSEGSVVCETATLSGTLAGAANNVTLHPVFGTCSAFDFVNIPVATTGCDFKLHSGALAGTGIWEGTLDVVCEAGKSITLTAFGCEVSIGSVNGLSELDLVDDREIPEDVTVRPLIGGIPYTVKKSGPVCALTTGSFTNGSMTGRYTVTATAGGKATAFFVE